MVGEVEEEEGEVDTDRNLGLHRTVIIGIYNGIWGQRVDISGTYD